MMFQQDATTRDHARLEDYLQAIRRQRLLVALSILAGLSLAIYAESSRERTYDAAANVVLYPTPVGARDSNLVAPNLDKEQAVLESTATAQSAADIMGADADALLSSVDVTFQANSDVLHIQATDPSADRAAEIANSFADAYVTERETAAVGYYTSREAAATENLVELRTALDELEQSDVELEQQRSQILRDEVDGPDRDARIAAIESEQSAIGTEASALRSEIARQDSTVREARFVLDTRTPTAEVIRRAVPPSSPSGLPRWLLLLGGLLGGLFVGVVLAFILERLDTTARDDDEVTLALNSSVVGSIPTLGLANRSGQATLVMSNTAKSGRIALAKEGFRRLRSAVQFLARDSGVSSLILTSASPAEGKSFVTANLAIALAQGGSRVILISADMRRPTQEKQFGIPPAAKGLSTFLDGDPEIPTVEIEGVDNLWLLPAGPLPDNPSELMGSPRFGELLELVGAEVDYAIVDSPPMLSTADVSAAARYVDGVMVVVDTRRTELAELLQVRADLERSGSRLMGVIMNRRRTDLKTFFRRGKYNYYLSE